MYELVKSNKVLKWASHELNDDGLMFLMPVVDSNVPYGYGSIGKGKDMFSWRFYRYISPYGEVYDIDGLCNSLEEAKLCMINAAEKCGYYVVPEDLEAFV
jgi:hypothetical protein